MKNDIGLAEILFFKHNWNELMKWLGDVLNSEFRGGLDFPIRYCVVDSILLCVEGLFRFWRLLIFGLRIQAVEEHQVDRHHHLLLLRTWLTIKLDPKVTNIVEFDFLFTELNEEGLSIKGGVRIHNTCWPEDMSFIEFLLISSARRLLLGFSLRVHLIVLTENVWMGIGT